MHRFVRSLFLLCFMSSLQAFAGTTGSIRGVITDREKNEPMAGVTVVARSPAVQGEVAALTDEQGLYVITALPPGTYSITALFAGATSERQGIEVQADKTVGINLAISLTAGAGEVYNIEEKAPNVDVATVTVGRTLTKEYIEKVPMGRSRDVSSALSVSPSATQERYGTGIGGSTAPENTYVIDSLNVTGISESILNTRLVLDFVEEFEVKEGGYGPEFGRATGGFINVVSKSGSNEFHGSAFAYYRPSWLQLKAREIGGEGSILSRSALDYYLSAGAEVGGPIVKDLLWFHVGYAPELRRENIIRTIRWLKGTSEAELSAAGEPVYENETFADKPYPGLSQSHQYTFKLTHLINNDNRHSLSVRGSPIFFNGYGGSDFIGVPTPTFFFGNPDTFNAKWSWNGNVWAAIYNFNGKYLNDKLKLDATLGAYDEERHYVPVTDVPRLVYFNDVNLRDVATFELPSACAEANDFKDAAGNSAGSRCRTGGDGFVQQGYNRVEDRRATRFVEKVALTSLFQFAGLHQLKYGIDFEQLLSLNHSYFPGGSRASTNGAGTRWTSQYYTVDGKKVDSSDVKVLTLNYGAFVGDSWSPLPNLVLNYGLRWEVQSLFALKDITDQNSLENRLLILDNLAPRAGLVWDFTGQGKGAMRFHYGRFFESMPLSYTERAFAGITNRIDRESRVNCYAGGANDDGSPKVAGQEKLSPFKVTDPLTQCQNLNSGFDSNFSSEVVAPGIKGQYTDEFILSFDYEPFPSWVFGVSGIYRYMGRGMEDFTPDFGDTFILMNPGEFDIKQLENVRNQLANTTDKVEQDRLKAILAGGAQIADLPKPKRETWQIQFKVDKKLSNNFQFNFSYVLGWTFGNYPGLFEKNTGLIVAQFTDQFDVPAIRLNRDGYLPQDVRHRFKLGGYYTAALKDFGMDVPLSFTLGTSAYLQSGYPYEVRGAESFYEDGDAWILPRGAGGRTPWTWNVDMNFGVTWNFTEALSVELFAAIYNLFNVQEVTDVDDQYTFDIVKPIVGGDKSQLAHLRNADGGPVLVRSNYGNATAYQDPFSAQFGARIKF